MCYMCTIISMSDLHIETLTYSNAYQHCHYLPVSCVVATDGVASCGMTTPGSIAAPGNIEPASCGMAMPGGAKPDVARVGLIKPVRPRPVPRLAPRPVLSAALSPVPRVVARLAPRPPPMPVPRPVPRPAASGVYTNKTNKWTTRVATNCHVVGKQENITEQWTEVESSKIATD